MRPLCLHPGCQNVAADGRRGLCKAHFDDPAVRLLYPTRRMGKAPRPGQAKCLHPGCQNVGPRHKSGRRGLCAKHFADPAVRALYPDRRRSTVQRPPACLHCKRGEVKIRARHLCASCNKKPEVRHLYPIVAHPAAVAKAEARAFKPCTAPPRSAGRLATMQRRIALNQPLHHPGDADCSAWETYQGEAVA